MMDWYFNWNFKGKVTWLILWTALCIFWLEDFYYVQKEKLSLMEWLLVKLINFFAGQTTDSRDWRDDDRKWGLTKSTGDIPASSCQAEGEAAHVEFFTKTSSSPLEICPAPAWVGYAVRVITKEYEKRRDVWCVASHDEFLNETINGTMLGYDIWRLRRRGASYWNEWLDNNI